MYVHDDSLTGKRFPMRIKQLTKPSLNPKYFISLTVLRRYFCCGSICLLLLSFSVLVLCAFMCVHVYMVDRGHRWEKG